MNRAGYYFEQRLAPYACANTLRSSHRSGSESIYENNVAQAFSPVSCGGISPPRVPKSAGTVLQSAAGTDCAALKMEMLEPPESNCGFLRLVGIQLPRHTRCWVCAIRDGISNLSLHGPRSAAALAATSDLTKTRKLILTWRLR
jgi:hypothetical protein